MIRRDDDSIIRAAFVLDDNDLQSWPRGKFRKGALVIILVISNFHGPAAFGDLETLRDIARTNFRWRGVQNITQVLNDATELCTEMGLFGIDNNNILITSSTIEKPVCMGFVASKSN